MANPVKRPAPFDPLGDVLRWLDATRPRPSKEEELKRVDAAMDEIQRRGGDKLLLAHLERYLPPEAPSVDDRALELGGGDLVSYFRAARRNGVSEEGQTKALDYLEHSQARARFRREGKRQNTAVSNLLPELNHWLRRGSRLASRWVEFEGEAHPALQPTRRLLLAVPSELYRLMLSGFIPSPAFKRRNPLPKTKTASAPLDEEGTVVKNKLYRLFLNHATPWDERKTQRKNLKEIAEKIVLLLGLKRKRRLKSEVGVRQPK